jgi:hypothetical protein
MQTMDSVSASGSPGNRTHWLAFAIVLVVGILVHGWIGLHAYTVTSFSDPMDYMFMADFYKALVYGGELDQAAQFYRASRYPPIFPMLLGVLGAGSDAVHLSCIISNVTAVLAALSVWWWIRVERGNPWTATLIALALLAYPSFFLLNMFPVSEPLAMVFMAAAFALLAKPHPTRSLLLVVGLLIGASLLVRTALLPLIPAFAIWLIIRRPVPFRHMLLPLMAACLPLLAWMAYRSLLKAESYTSSLTAEKIIAALGGWPDALWVQPTRLFEAWVANWGALPGVLVISVSALLALLAVAGCVIRLRRNAIDAWFLAGYIAMILVWPYPDEFGRFLVVVYPCILLCCLSATSELSKYLRSSPGSLRSQMASLLLFVAVALATTPTAMSYAKRAALPVDEELLGDKREPLFFHSPTDEDALFAAELFARMRMTAQAATELVPEGGCIYAVYSQFIPLVAGRRGVTYPFELEDEQSGRERLIACDYFFLVGLGTIQTKSPPMYPWHALNGWTEPLLTSEISLRGETSLAAALLKRSDKPVPALLERIKRPE